jgi:hypothetical protein
MIGLNDASGEAILYNWENQAMIFGTNGVERMQIDAAGNVGIGTTTPTAVLHTFGSVRHEGLTGGGNLLGVDANGNVIKVAPAIYNSSGNCVTPPTAGTYAFCGPTVSVVVNSTSDVIYFTGNITLGSVNAGGANNLNIFPGYTFNGGALVLVGGGTYGLSVAQNTRHTFGTSYAYTGLAPGTYVFGVGASIAVTPANWNSNEYGYVTAIKF